MTEQMCLDDGGETKASRERLLQAIEDRAPLLEIQRLYVGHVLDQQRGNKSDAAKTLGIDRRTIQRWAAKARHGRPAKP